MFTSTDLLELHTRAQANLATLLTHCRALSPEELHRELPGFGYPTVQAQLHHIIDTWEWWIGILQGRYEYVDTVAQYPTISALEAFREQVAAGVAAYLAGAADTEVNRPRAMRVWEDKRQVLIPALVFMRPLTHAFHHQGQVAAMCRLLGHPTPPLDFPILP
jgi:uncharacterized damage-inducible protein DinB